MRKADYLKLAAILARHYRGALVQAANARGRGEADAQAYTDGRADAVRSVADCFARECETVNRAAFLAACGVRE
jgi:hypothetical protein